MKGFRLALGFLTIIPVRFPGEFQPGDLGRSAAWFPLIGLLLGAVIALAFSGLTMLLPGMTAAVLVVAFWALLTGGLHLDGLADCGDGLLAAAPVEKRLEIMKDPRLGSFGGTALVLHLLLKVSLLAALAGGPARLRFAAVLFAPVIARWLILIVGRQPMARPGGLGVEFKLGLTWRMTLYAAVIPLGMLILGSPFLLVPMLAAALLAHLVTFAVIGLASRRLGGVTGDVIGLAVELSESAVLLAFAAWLTLAG